jgi:hypothetical protein
MKSEDKLKEASKHITYEWLMFYQTYIALHNHHQPNQIPYGVTYAGDLSEPSHKLEPSLIITPEQALYNANLESFLIHARNLIFFFNRRSGEKTDILAIDFFPKSTDWITSKVLTDDYNKMHKYLAHLTDDRKTSYTWDFRHIYEELDKQMIEFVEKVDPSYVRSELRKCLYGEEE